MDQIGIKDELPCPLCRHMFTIPPQGLSGLPNNFFIQNMIDLENKTETDPEKMSVEVKCDLCLDENDSESSPTASHYCSDCNQNMCKSCVTCHAKMNSTKSHALYPPTLILKDPTKAAKIYPGTCEKHSNQPLNAYCLKCDVCICLSCIITEHNEHRCEDIKDAFTRFLDLFDANISSLRVALTLGYRSLLDLKSAEDHVVKESSNNEQKIRERCYELRKVLDSFEEELLSEARQFREKKVKEIRSQIDQIEIQNLQLESFDGYLSKLKEKGSSHDVASGGKELVARAENLLTSSKEKLKHEFKTIHMKFVPVNVTTGGEYRKALLGELVTGGMSN